MDILEFILKEGLVMIPVLFIIGEIIKHTELINDRWIPTILLLVSIVLTPLILTGYNALNIVQAILVTGATVLTNELNKQAHKKE